MPNTHRQAIKDQKVQQLIVFLYGLFLIFDAYHGFRYCILILKVNALLALTFLAMSLLSITCWLIFTRISPLLQAQDIRFQRFKQDWQYRLSLARENPRANKVVYLIDLIGHLITSLIKIIKKIYKPLAFIIGEATPISVMTCFFSLKCGYDLSTGLALGSASGLSYYFNQCLGFSLIQALILTSGAWLSSLFCSVGLHWLAIGYNRFIMPNNRSWLSSQSLFCLIAFTGACHHQRQFFKHTNHKPSQVDRTPQLFQPTQDTRYRTQQKKHRMTALILELCQLGLLLPITQLNPWSHSSQGLRLPQAADCSAIIKGLQSLPMLPLFTCVASLLCCIHYHHHPLLSLAEGCLALLAQGLANQSLIKVWHTSLFTQKLNTLAYTYHSQKNLGQLTQALLAARLTMLHHDRLLKPLVRTKPHVLDNIHQINPELLPQSHRQRP